MARPKKKTVDYFPHYVDHGKTMFILEQKYGNDGYTFWFKLLEMLGKSAGHYLDLNDETVWEFLQAKTRLGEDSCAEILTLLAKLDAIDPELWSVRVVWSQNFVDGISDVYRNRRVDIPVRPSFYIKKPRISDVPTAENPQRKVKESKVNQSKAEEEHVAASCDLDFGEAYWMFEQEFGRPLSSIEAQEIERIVGEYGAPLVKEALRRAVVQGKRNLKYTEGILRRWKDAGLKSLVEVLDYEERIEAQRAKHRANGNKEPPADLGRVVESEKRRRQETIAAACSYIRVTLGDKPSRVKAEEIAQGYGPELVPDILQQLYGGEPP